MTKTVLTYGTFDMFHIGHLNLINRLAAMGERLIVAVSSDAFNEEKGKKCIIPYDQRAQIVGAIKGVDLVIPEHSWEQKVSDIQTHDVDVFAMGDDWQGKFDFLREHCEVHYFGRTEGISTNALKRSLNTFLSVPKEELVAALEVLEILKGDLA
ncbi:MAG: adenylyltransferase/cytidyltransferase family protein [Spongiibacteraceae bacterium]